MKSLLRGYILCSLLALVQLSENSPVFPQYNNVSIGPELWDDALSPSRIARRDAAAPAFFPKCYKSNVSKMGLAKRCQSFLNQLGSQECKVTHQTAWSYMCNYTEGASSVFIRAQPLSGVDETSSPCSDVARGMDWIFDLCSPQGCTADDCPVGGTNAAWRNGNLVLEIVGNDKVLSSS